MIMLKVGMKIELDSGKQYEVVKVFDGGIYDIKELKGSYPTPEYKRTYYSIMIVNCKILHG